MELDKRIKNRGYILDCFNAHIAEQYIGEECYMTSFLEAFSDLSRMNKCCLDSVKNSFFYNKEVDKCFDFCLPVSLVSEPKEEKTYRPYTLEEFTEKFQIGSPIKFRRKGKKETERYLILNGYQNEHEQYNDQTVTFIHLGAYPYSLKELFDGYEWQSQYTSTGGFEPFGVEE